MSLLNKRIVQKDLNLELNRNIKSVADKFIDSIKTKNGFKVILHENQKIEAFKAKNMNDLDSFYQGKSEKKILSKENAFEVVFEIIKDDVVRIKVNYKEGEKKSFIHYENIDIKGEYYQTDETINYETDNLIISFHKKELIYCITHKKNKVIFEENNIEKSIYHGYYSPPLSKVKRDGLTYFAQSFKRKYDEDFYGFGEQFVDFNKRGQEVEIWNEDPANTMSFKSYKNIPFFVSTKGYGFLVNGSAKTYFDMGTKTSNAWSVQTSSQSLDYIIILKKDLKDILHEYYQITQKPALPPKWSFGLWMSSISRYQSEEAVLEVAKEIREKKLPCDVLHIDPPWMNQEHLICDLVWGENFKNHKEMIKKINNMGFKISLWISPYVPMKGKMYEEGIDNKYFVVDKQGELIVNQGPMNFWSPPFVYIDFTNKDAVKWYQQKLFDLFKEGQIIIKTDLGELGPMEASYANGMEGNEGHNYYPYAYQKAVFEAAKNYYGEDEAMIWCRSGFIGSCAYPVHWVGDVKCDFDNMAGQLRAILNAGLSGFLFMSHDIGGFSGESCKELYVRWFQMGMFTSHARAHGTRPHEPWHFGKEAEKICLYYAKLRYSLIPTIYSHAIKCTKEYEPFLKPLILEYQKDQNVRNISDTYLFCDDMLIAPVFAKEEKREIYLPEGIWVDFFTKEIYSGRQWIEYDCKLDIIPIFIKKGSIILKQQYEEYISEEPKKYIIEIYPDDENEKVIYLKKDKKVTIKYKYLNKKIDLDIDGDLGEYSINIIE